MLSPKESQRAARLSQGLDLRTRYRLARALDRVDRLADAPAWARKVLGL